MQIGTLRPDKISPSIKINDNDVHQQEKTAKIHPESRRKVKEYPDFDYKYELKRRKPPPEIDLADILAAEDPLKHNPPGEIEINIENMKPPAKPKTVQNRRRSETLNGVRLSSLHDQFDVVGGLDLFTSEQLDNGYDEFKEDEDKVVIGEGEGGLPVNLSPEESKLGEKIMAKEAFNLVASDKMSLHRSVPDTRDPRCLDIKYDKSLPTASVIIIFTNEAWTPLLRTIWSVLDKTPAEYLHEIILVDDFSDKKYLKGKLERYFQKKLPSKVRLKRLNKRSGLIRARLTGARLATGDTLVFLDSHCECGDEWLQPLLHRIKEEPKAFVVPIIGILINIISLYYTYGHGY